MVQPAGPGPVPLWRQLQAAAGVLEAVLAGRSATEALATTQAALRPAAQALSFHAMRELGRAQALRAQLARRAPPPAADALLLTALALAWDAPRAPYEPFTLVDQAVEAAKHHAGMRAQSGFINACLRRFLRERETLLTRTQDDPQARWNHPLWWIERLQRDYPQHWTALLEQAQKPAPMTLRVNRQRQSVASYQERLQATGLAAGQAVGASGVQLQQAVAVHQLPGFEGGDVSVQDAAAQLAAPLLLQGLPAQQPLRVLDACAAPGGKTGHLLELRPDAEVVALEIDASRCERIHQNLRRLSVHAEVRQADASQPQAWWDGRSFDAILLDAPCTASGIVRRHPDVRWLRRPEDSAQLARTQAALLDALWPLLVPGGRLLYCTCSLFRTEGDEVIQAFLARNTQASLCPSPGHLIPAGMPAGGAVGDNALGEHDCFYYALLEKAASPA